MCLTMPPFILGEDLWPRGSPSGSGLLSSVSPCFSAGLGVGWDRLWPGSPVLYYSCTVVFSLLTLWSCSGLLTGTDQAPSREQSIFPLHPACLCHYLRSSSPPGGDGRAGPSLSRCVATSGTIPGVLGPDGWSSIFTRAGAVPACLLHSLWKTRVPGPAASLRGAAVSTGEDLGSLHLFGLQERRMLVAFQQTVALPAVLDPTSFLWAWS